MARPAEVPSAAARARARAARAVWDVPVASAYGVPSGDPSPFYEDTVLVGTLDDVMAGLVGELDQAGDFDGVQLLLMPTDGRRH